MIVPVILAGGSGTRLWPLSRRSYPKQFCRLVGEHSLFQQVVLRCADDDRFGSPLVVTSEEYYFICCDQLSEIGVRNASFILEPCAKNTAPAVALAAKYIQSNQDAGVRMLVMPADHLISDSALFCEKIIQMASVLGQNDLGIFGIDPRSPETGYGYIEAGQAHKGEVHKVKSFAEKPNYELALKFIESDNYYWNSGIFLFTAEAYLKSLACLAADIYQQMDHAFASGHSCGNYFKISADAFEQCRAESVDKAVLEKASNVLVMRYAGQWSDIGSWTSLAEICVNDDDNNHAGKNVFLTESKDCYVHPSDQLVVGIGLSGLIIAPHKDAILIADKQHAQQLKESVSMLKSISRPEATEHQKVHRPWGYYECLATGDNYKVKRLCINAGASISLQLHQYRAEHWVVVSGEAVVINQDKEFKLTSNQSTFIPCGAKHRLSNPLSTPLYVIEVQSGEYLGEDDIVRFDDVYARPTSVVTD